MSKSLGNLIMLDQFLNGCSPNGIRIYLARHHYRGPWSHDPEELADSEKLAKDLWAASESHTAFCNNESAGLIRYRQAFREAFDDDLDTPRVVCLVPDLVRETGASSLLREVEKVLGLSLNGNPDRQAQRERDRHLTVFR